MMKMKIKMIRVTLHSSIDVNKQIASSLPHDDLVLHISR